LNSGLLATKLRCPALLPRRVQRPHLIQRLNAGFEAGRQITLVSAPAGFGKTTCIAEWVNALDCPVTWLSLDAADNDPGRFFTYLVAALHKVDETLGREIGGVLRAGQVPPGEVIHTALSNDILAWDQRFVLVLDDFHLIQDRSILQVLENLVANLPPALHLVLISREDPSLPLARLRAHNRLTEIRVGDLRFSSHEAGRFLDEVMGLSLSPIDVAVLDDKTEGWIVGLQLAGITLQTAPEAKPTSPAKPVSPLPDRVGPSPFIAALSGSHRFILSYLTEEVLNQQPEEIRDFLLQTAILDRLNGDLCNAVTGRTDSHTLLKRLFNANLFLIPLDEGQQWYRYHHLFADLLRDRQRALRPDQTAELHRRAGLWYVRASEEARRPLDERGAFAGEAIQHALAGSEYALALQLVETHAVDTIMQGRVQTVTGWMQAIPPEWSASSPRANMAFAWMHFLRGTMAQAAPYLARLEAIFSQPQMDEKGDPSLQAQWLALQATVRNTQRKPLESLALANQALELVPRTDDYVLSLIYVALADAFQQLDDHGRAAEAFQRIVHHGRAAGNLVVEIMGTAGMAAMALRQGQLQHAFEIASEGIDQVERSGSLPPLSSTLYGALGQICYQWNQIEQARRYYLRATQVSALSGYRDTEISYLVLLSRLYQVEGDLEASAREINKAVDLLRGGAAAWVRPEVISQQVRTYLAQDNPAAAQAVLRQGGVLLEDEITYATDPLHLAHLRLLLYRGEQEHKKGELRQASELAQRIIASAGAGQRTETRLQALILGARVWAASGDTRGSLELLGRALALAELERYVRIFLDEGPPVAGLLRRAGEQGVGSEYARELLALFPSAVGEAKMPSGSAGPVEPLSERELEILHLIHEGCSNQEIARRLVITLYTVKKHNSNIYGKLGVHSRTQAIARARQLGLL
jgi:LuxR family maltose regulon positive regulatory protein